MLEPTTLALRVWASPKMAQPFKRRLCRLWVANGCFAAFTSFWPLPS